MATETFYPKADGKSNRLGPDIPFTHWMLYFKCLMRWLCKRKFRRFLKGSEFRPGAYAVWCDHISIGYNVVIRPNTMLFAEPEAYIYISDDVLIGAGVHIYTNNHRFDNKELPIIHQGYKDIKDVYLCKGCWIGANSTILPGVTVGVNAVVGAGSVVTKVVPSHTIVAGNPAREVRCV